MANSSSYRVTIKGDKRLIASMDAATRDLEDLTATNREVAQAAARGSASRAPVATGELRASITGEANETTATVRATAKHAGPIHYGVPSRGIAANPFIVAAMVADESTFVDMYQRRLERLTKEMAE